MSIKYVNEVSLNRQDFERIEQIILELGDAFEIRVQWDQIIVLLTGACAIAGGIFGGYAGGRIGATVGASVGAVAGFATASLREIWQAVRQNLQELIYIVLNYLRQLDPIDYVNAIRILMACAASKRELVLTILEILALKLGGVIVSNLTAA